MLFGVSKSVSSVIILPDIVAVTFVSHKPAHKDRLSGITTLTQCSPVGSGSSFGILKLNDNILARMSEFDKLQIHFKSGGR